MYSGGTLDRCCPSLGKINHTHGPARSSKRNVFSVKVQIHLIGDIDDFRDKVSWLSFQLVEKRGKWGVPAGSKIVPQGSPLMP